MVHGVLRNLKLEAPRPSQEEARLTAASAAASAEETLEADNSTVAENAARVSPPASAAGGDDDLREGLPASLGRLGEGRSDNDVNTGSLATSSGAAAKKVSPPSQKPQPSPKYTWFSLYDEQEVGRRRISPSHNHVFGDAETEPSTVGDGGVAGRGGSDPEYGARTPKQRSGKGSSKPGGSWRWGWGRREHSPRAPAATTPENGAGVEAAATEVAAAAGAEAGAARGRGEQSSGTAITPQVGGGEIAAASCGRGGQEGDGPDVTGDSESAKRDEDGEWGEAPQVLEVLTAREVPSSGESRAGGAAAKAVAAGRKVAEKNLEHERRRLKRKDVYSYFMMPLIRALEAQMGTTAWLRKLLESEGSKEIPTSAVSLWLPPDPDSKQDVMRVLRRLFASPDEIADGGESEQGRQSAPLSEGGGAVCNGTSGTSTGRQPCGKGVPRISGAPHGYPMPPAAARVAFPSLIARYGGEVKRKNDDAERAADWLDSDETVCTALEVDVHALAMLVFVEWREFVTAIPGCGAVLSRETSALWFAQIRQRWACQATLHTCSAVQRPPPSFIVGDTGTQPPSPAFDSAGRPSKMPASALGAPLLSRLEPEITADHFGVAVRMACADASAPYTLPLQDQHMFPDDLALPVCLVQRYEHREENGGRRGAREERVDASIGGGATAAGRSSDTAVGVDKEELIVARTSPPDRSRSPSPSKRAAARRAGSRGRRRRSKSSSPPGEAGFRNGMAGRSLSPLMSKGRGFFLSSSKSPRWRPSIRSPGRRRGARAGKKGGRDSAANDGNAAGDGRGAWTKGAAVTATIRGTGLDTPPTARRGVRASPMRKSPVASPVRPPLKPMAAEQHQHQGEGQPEDDASRSASGGTKSRSAAERSSLLDGVEQSSDLGAFFRQGEAGQGGNLRRRRGRRSSPRRRGVSPRAGGSPKAGLRRSSRRGDVAVDASEEGGGKGGPVWVFT
ncbi:unnamed protein product [Scytosiphon promiscuus]